MRENRYTAWIWIILLGAFAACGETASVAPGDLVDLEVAPTGPASLFVGDTLHLRVAVQNSSNQAVAFRSTADSVATVNSAGVVTAVSVGTATILVTPAADPSVQAAVVVRVLARPPTQGGSASVTLTGVLDPTSRQPVTEPASGRILIRVDYTPGRANRLEVLAGDSVACAMRFDVSGSRANGVALSAIPAECVLNTARFDTISGAVAFPNGPVAITARLLGPADSVQASASPTTLTLANPNTLLARTSAPRAATDAQGLRWVDGPVTVTAVPVLYSPESSVARTQFTYRTPGGESIVRSDSAAPFTVVLPENLPPSEGGLLGVTDSVFRVTVSSVMRSGTSGPQALTAATRYDNEPPVAGGVIGRSWIGARTRFAELYSSRGEQDRGVGQVAARFFVGDPTASGPQIVSRGREVQLGSDLEEGPVGTYRLAVQVCDALTNCRVAEGFAFGVDLTPPTISAVNLPDRAINPDGSLGVSVQDDRSGFSERNLQAAVSVVDHDSNTAACGPRVEGVDLAGTLVDGACAPDTVAALFTPRSTPGYYTYTVAPLDQAGNLGAPVSRTILVDRVAPTIVTVTLPAQLTPGRDATVRVEAEDNFDLLSAAALLVFPTPQGERLALPFAAPDTAGAPFDSELVRRHPFSMTFPLLGTLTLPEPGESLANARTQVVDSLRVRVLDVARQTVERGTALSIPAPPGILFTSLDSVSASLGQQNVCTARCLATDPTSTTVTARLIGPPAFRNPFEQGRVYFFSQDANGEVRLLGSTASFSISAAGSRQTISFSFTLRAPPGLTGEFTIFAVGSNGVGNGLRIGSARLRLFTR